MSRCFNESIRIQPPLYYSTPHRMTKEVNVGGLVLREGDTFVNGISHMCNAPSEWIEPGKFMPERFDSNSPLSLTPSGQKRNTFSFAPFTAGHRICIGMTFVQNVSKTLLPSLIHHMKFKAIDADFKMPYNNVYERLTHTFNVKASPRRV